MLKKKDYHVISFSGGKDSTAMLLRMMELGYQIDEVIWCDTTIEFPAMYDHVNKVRKIVEENGIKFSPLKSNYDSICLFTELFKTPFNCRKNSLFVILNPFFNLSSSKANRISRFCTDQLSLKSILGTFSCI